MHFGQLLPQLLPTASGSFNIQQFLLIVLDINPRLKTKHWASTKAALQEGSSREPPDRLKNENSLRMGL